MKNARKSIEIAIGIGILAVTFLVAAITGYGQTQFAELYDILFRVQNPQVRYSGTLSFRTLGNVDTVQLGATGNLVFEGATADAFETVISITDPTADQTLTIPDKTGTALIGLTNTAVIDFASTAANVCSAETAVTVTGAVAGDVAYVNVPTAAAAGPSVFVARVSAADTAQVKHCNISAGAVDPASATFRVVVLRSY